VGRLAPYFAVRVEPVADAVTVVTASGELDPASSDVLFEALLRALAVDRAGHITVDLANVTLLDASAIGVLLAAQNRANAAGKMLSVRAVNGLPLRVLEITGLLARLNGKLSGDGVDDQGAEHRLGHDR
jgi:anti-anti-sigma factor